MLNVFQHPINLLYSIRKLTPVCAAPGYALKRPGDRLRLVLPLRRFWYAAGLLDSLA